MVSSKSTRTKKYILSIFFQQMESIGFDKITVTGLAKEAGVNRGTIYSYFPDKYAILEETKAKLLLELNNLVSQRLSPEYLEYLLNKHKVTTVNQISSAFAENILVFIDYLSENQEILRIFLGPKGEHSFVRQLEQIFKTNLFTKISVSQKKAGSEYEVEFISSAIIAVLEHWIITGTKESPDELGIILTKCMSVSPFSLVGEIGLIRRKYVTP